MLYIPRNPRRTHLRKFGDCVADIQPPEEQFHGQEEIDKSVNFLTNSLKGSAKVSLIYHDQKRDERKMEKILKAAMITVEVLMC